MIFAIGFSKVSQLVSKIYDNIKISFRQQTLSIAEMIRVLFSYDIVFRTVNVLFIIDSDCRVLTVVIAHVACPAEEADSTVCLQCHNILGCSFGGFHSIPEGDPFSIRIAHEAILHCLGAKKDMRPNRVL